VTVFYHCLLNGGYGNEEREYFSDDPGGGVGCFQAISKNDPWPAGLDQQNQGSGKAGYARLHDSFGVYERGSYSAVKIRSAGGRK
jgi:hypothetical protein